MATPHGILGPTSTGSPAARPPLEGPHCLRTGPLAGPTRSAPGRAREGAHNLSTPCSWCVLPEGVWLTLHACRSAAGLLRRATAELQSSRHWPCRRPHTMAGARVQLRLLRTHTIILVHPPLTPPTSSPSSHPTHPLSYPLPPPHLSPPSPLAPPNCPYHDSHEHLWLQEAPTLSELHQTTHEAHCTQHLFHINPRCGCHGDVQGLIEEEWQ